MVSSLNFLKRVREDNRGGCSFSCFNFFVVYVSGGIINFEKLAKAQGDLEKRPDSRAAKGLFPLFLVLLTGNEITWLR